MFLTCLPISNTPSANPGTITGSIGVATLRPVITEKLLSAIGVNVDQITFSNGAHNLSMFHDMDEAALRRHIQSTTHIYNEFKARVALGRSMDVAAVEKVAGGRVFTGSQAHKLGLIDHVGGLQSSIRIAAELGWKRRLGVDVNKAGIAVPENHQIEIYPKQKSWVEKLFDSDKTAAGKGEITVVFKELIKSSIEELIQEETPPAFEQSLLF